MISIIDLLFSFILIDLLIHLSFSFIDTLIALVYIRLIVFSSVLTGLFCPFDLVEFTFCFPWFRNRTYIALFWLLLELNSAAKTRCAMTLPV